MDFPKGNVLCEVSSMQELDSCAEAVCYLLSRGGVNIHLFFRSKHTPSSQVKVSVVLLSGGAYTCSLEANTFSLGNRMFTSEVQVSVCPLPSPARKQTLGKCTFPSDVLSLFNT